jgi:hypothetical protein
MYRKGITSKEGTALSKHNLDTATTKNSSRTKNSYWRNRKQITKTKTYHYVMPDASTIYTKGRERRQILKWTVV